MNDLTRRLVELLRKHEWCDQDGGVCPSCGGYDDTGHDDDCEWVTLLAEAEST